MLTTIDDSSSERALVVDREDAIEAINHDSIEAEVAVADTSIFVFWLFLACMAALMYQYYFNRHHKASSTATATAMRSSTSTSAITASMSSAQNSKGGNGLSEYSSKPAAEVEMRTLDPYTDW